MKVLKVVPSSFINESRDLREVITLGKSDYEVLVLAMQGENLQKDEKNNDFYLRRLKVSKLNNKTAFGKIIKHFSFFIKAIKEGVIYKPSIISGHDFPGLLVAYSISVFLLRKPKILYDSHELGQHMASNSKYPKGVIKVKNLVEKFLINKSDAVMVVSPSISDYMKRELKLRQAPVVIRNTPEYIKTYKKHDLFREKFNIAHDKKIYLYQGLIAEGRGIDTIIKSLPYTNENIVLIIMGYGNIDMFKKLVEENMVENKVYFHSAVDYVDLLKYTSSADVGISLIQNICLSYYYSLPNKLFEYVQASIPVITSDFPDMKKIVEENKMGLTVDPSNHKELALAINSLSEDNKMYLEFKHNVIENRYDLSWDKEKEVLISLYNQLRK